MNSHAPGIGAGAAMKILELVHVPRIWYLLALPEQWTERSIAPARTKRRGVAVYGGVKN